MALKKLDLKKIGFIVVLAIVIIAGYFVWQNSNNSIGQATGTGSFSNLLVSNPGFENGTTGWTLVAPSGNQAEVVAGSAHSGSKSLRLVNSTGATSGLYAASPQIFLNQTTPLPVYMSNWAYRNSTDSIALITMEVLARFADGTHAYYAGTLKTKPEYNLYWAKYDAIFVPTKPIKSIQIFFVNYAQGTVFFDDVVVFSGLPYTEKLPDLTARFEESTQPLYAGQTRTFYLNISDDFETSKPITVQDFKVRYEESIKGGIPGQVTSSNKLSIDYNALRGSTVDVAYNKLSWDVRCTSYNVGTRVLKGIIDSTNTISESNENNNTATISVECVSAPSTLPDLLTSNIIATSSAFAPYSFYNLLYVEKATLRSGQSASVKVEVANKGSTNSGAFTYTVKDNGSKIVEKAVSGLTKANTSGSYSYATFNFACTSSNLGLHSFEVATDVSNTVTESNESNNLSVGKIECLAS